MRLVTCSENLSFKNLEGALTILCALTQKRTILFSTILFWVSAQSIVKTPSKFLKLGTHRAGDQPLNRFRKSIMIIISMDNQGLKLSHATLQQALIK